MRRALAKHEFRAVFADRLVWVVALTLFTTLGYGTWVGRQAIERHRDAVGLAVAADSQSSAILQAAMAAATSGEANPAASQDPRRPFVAGRAMGAQHAILPIAPFQVSAVGQLDLFSPAVLVSLDGADFAEATEEIENPVHLLSGPLDLAFLITFLLPLLALALSFDMLSREKEAGTLGLLLSQPIPVARVIWIKSWVRWGVLVAITLGITAFWMSVFGQFDFFGMSLWSGIVGLYVAFWVGLAALVNLTGGTSPRNAMVLAFSWIVLTVALPTAMQMTAALVYPVSSRGEWLALEREELSQVQAASAQVLAAYYEEHPELMPAGTIDEVDFQIRTFAIREEARKRVEPVKARYRAQRHDQQELIHRLRWASPVTFTWVALLDLAGTGDLRLTHFESEVIRHHAAWNAYFAPRIYADQRLSPSDLGDFPVWRFDDHQRGFHLARVFPGMLGLFAFVGLLAVIGGRILALRRDGGWV
jgi:ABC-2 type transport system permease protein